MRRVSIIIFLISIALPIAWSQIELNIVYGEPNERGYICGLPALAIYFTAACGMGLLSIIAAVTGTIAAVKQPAPVTILRKLEVSLLYGPFLFSVIFLAFLFLL